MPGPKPRTFRPVDAPPSAEELASEGSLTREAAAEFAGVSLREIDYLLAARVLPSFRWKKRRLIPKRALVLWQAKLIEEATK